MKLTRDKVLYIFLLSLLISCGKRKEDTLNKTVFKCNLESVLGSLDPAFATDQSSRWMTAQLFNGLVELDSSLKVQPALAESWQLSEDLMTYTFKIRDEVYFHDHELFKNGKGRAVTANDVVYSFKRICDTTSIYNKGIWIFKDKVLKDRHGHISDTCFKAVDDRTLKIYLNAPFPHFMQILAMHHAFVVPKEVAEHYGPEFRRNPIGTGPFRFKMWEEGNTLIMLRNEKYWKRDNKGSSLPYLDAVQVYFTPDKGQAFRSFMLGGLSYFNGLEYSFIDDVLYSDGTFKASIQEKFRCQKSPYLNTEYIGFQLDKSSPCYEGVADHPFFSKEFRQALNYAIDRERLLTTLKNGIGEAGTAGIVPTAVPYFNSKKVIGYNYQPEKARELFEKSGWKGRMPAIAFPISNEYKDVASFLVKQWEEVLGIKVQIQLKEVKAIRGLANKGEVAMFRASWLGDYPDAENYLALFYGNNHTPNGPNKVHFSSNKYDSLYRKAKYIEDLHERYRLFEKLDQIMIDEAPVLVLFYDEIIRLSDKGISGFGINAMNDINLERVTISE